jgi:hypothetical protein
VFGVFGACGTARVTRGRSTGCARGRERARILGERVIPHHGEAESDKHRKRKTLHGPQQA